MSSERDGPPDVAPDRVSGPPTRVRILIPGIELAFEGRQAWYDAHLDGLVAGVLARRFGPLAEAEEVLLPPPPPPHPRPPPAHFVPESAHFAGFLQQVGSRATEAEDQVLAFGFFLWNYERMADFGTEELVGCFRSVGLPVPEDLTEILVGLEMGARHLSAEGDDRWTLTPRGVAWVKRELLG